LAKLKAFCPEDLKLNVFMAPFFMLHIGQALRVWEDQVNNPDSIIGKHPADFRLVQVGEFDDATGELTPMRPNPVATALEYLRKAPPQLPRAASV